MSFIDRYKIITSILMVVLGGIITYRSIVNWTNIMIFVFGVSFLGFGLYRLKFVIDYYRSRKG